MNVTPCQFEFGSFALDPARRLFLRDGEPVPLTPKTFDTLLFLVEHRERVITKEELLRALWPDIIVEEASLSQQIFLLRKTLNTGSEEAEYVATIPRRGYRFVAPVREIPSLPSAEPNGSVATTTAAARGLRALPAARRRHVVWAGTMAAAVIALAVGVRMRSLSSTPQVTQLAVWPPPGTLSWGSPVVSPDGRSVAFRAQDRDGRSLLWVRRFDSPNAAALAGTEGADFPFWSPDGRWLAFFSQGKLRKISARGGLAQILCDASAGRGGTWNREDVIVFAPDARSVLYRVPAAGGLPVPVTSFGKPPAERSHRFPHFLDDGRHFIYVAVTNTIPHTVVIGSLDSQTSHDVISGSWSGETYAPPGFLVFRRDGMLVAQPFRSSGLRLVGAARPLADYVPPGRVYGHENFSASANGVLTYLGGTPRTTELVWYDRAGRRLGTMGPPGDYSQLSLSGDESRAAVVRIDPATRRHEIWVIDAKRGSLARVTVAPPDADDPVWSPDGRHLAFDSTNRSGNGEVHIKAWSDARSEETVLSSSGNNWVQDWSLDGQLILFAREEEPTPIRNFWTVPVLGNRAPLLFLKTKFQTGAAHFSPDGRWIAYASDESGRFEVYVASFPKADIKRQVSTDGGEQPQWRRDGRALFFVSGDGTLMASDIRGDDRLNIGVPKSLFVVAGSRSDDNTDPLRWTYAVAANGERFLIDTPRDEERLPINVVFNWTSLLTGR